MKNTWLIPLIEELEAKEFYGKVTLNFCKGEIPNINKEESIKPPKTWLHVQMTGNPEDGSSKFTIVKAFNE